MSFGGPGFPPMGGPGGDNPLWEAVKQVQLDEGGTISLLMQMPEFIEDEDMKIAQKHYPVLIRNFIIGTILGTAANLQLKRIPNFLEWNRFLRYGIRIPVFILPFGIFYSDTTKRVGEMHNALKKYQKRFTYFQKTGDFRYLDPEGKLARRHKERMG
jgi:Predicted membrane protein